MENLQKTKSKLYKVLFKITLSSKQTTWADQDGWMNSVLGYFYALSRLNWAGVDQDFMRMNEYQWNFMEKMVIC